MKTKGEVRETRENDELRLIFCARACALPHERYKQTNEVESDERDRNTSSVRRPKIMKNISAGMS